MEQQDTTIRPITLSSGLEELDQLHERSIQTVDRVGAVLNRVVKELVMDVFLLQVCVPLGPEVQDHVINALEGIPRNARVGSHHVQVVVKRAFPVLLAEFAAVQMSVHYRQDAVATGHPHSPNSPR